MARFRLDRKHCPTCDKDFPLTETWFSKTVSRPDGWNRECKNCFNKRRRAKRRAQRAVKYGEPKTMPREYRTYTPEAFEKFYNKVSGLILPEHAVKWVRAALENKRLLLNVPPRHAKTTIMAIWFAIWRFACDRDTQVLIISKTNMHGQKIARKIAYELEFNRELIALAGTFRPLDPNRPWAVGDGNLEIEGKDLSKRSGDLSLQIRGSGQQILGMEADWIMADDITDRRVYNSETQTRDEWDWFLGDCLTRLSPEGKVFCIGQRVHGSDIYGRLAVENDSRGESIWEVVTTPALDKEGKALWPDQWPASKLLEQRLSIGESLFNCMYQQTPMLSGEFVPAWWVYGSETDPDAGCLDYDRTLGQGWAGNEVIPVTRVLSVDPSPTRFAALVVADVVYQHQAEQFWCSIVDIRRDRMGQRVMLEHIEDLQEKHSPTAIIFESNSVKWLHEDVLWNSILRLFRVTVDHKTGQNKNDQLMGVWSLAADIEAGRIRFPYGDDASRVASDYLIDEILAYPNGRTDDVLMALWFIKYSYKSLLPASAFAGGFNGRHRPAWDMKKIETEGKWAVYA